MKTQTKKDKRAYIIIALIVALLLLAVGYASFTETLVISGTVGGTATWEVIFDESSTGGTTAISNDGHTLTADVTLGYPGDAQEITAVIKNNSSMPIKISNFSAVGPTDTTNLAFDYVTLDENETIDAGGTCTYTFVVGWKEDSTVESVSGTYSFTFDYVQDTTTSSASASHTNN